MNNAIRTVLAVLFVLAAAQVVTAEKVIKRVAVNDYFGMNYDREPVSFDIELDKPVSRDLIGVRAEGKAVPCQVEVLEGTAAKVKRAKVWVLVSFPFVESTRTVGKGDDAREEKVMVPGGAEDRHRIYEVTLLDRAAAAAKSPITSTRKGEVGGVPVTVVSNGIIRATIPSGSAGFSPAASALTIPGPVVAIARGDEEPVGDGYLDAMRRVESVDCEVDEGPIYWQSTITYRFEGGKIYRSRVRLYASKPYAQLVEDFNVGGASKFVFNYNDWRVDGFFRTGDQNLVGWRHIAEENPCADFVRIDGQEALARMVIWTQFNYFGGKQETIALKQPDMSAVGSKYEDDVARWQNYVERYQQELGKHQKETRAYEAAMKKYEADMAAYKKDPKQFNSKPREPRKPKGFRMREPGDKPAKPVVTDFEYALRGATMQTMSQCTPQGDSTAVGAFYIRPDRWTRAKVNHVDLYLRPEVPGDRMTRGVVGLNGAKLRPAMEAWIVDGHREWAIFAVRSGDNSFFAKAHVQEGVWPLDRLNKLPLVWNSGGAPVKPEETKPDTDSVAGGPAQAVLKGTGGRSGLQYFNGSNGQIRGASPRRDGWNGEITSPVSVTDGGINDMVAKAMTAYMASDDSAYPGIRAMLPWTHPEAINPFYQGMENMNFNADLYRYVCKHGVDLAHMGHPEAQRFIDHAEESFDMALDRYVYPESGCWEESHGYAGHTLGVVGPLAVALKNSEGRRNFLDDVRLARMLEFFIDVHSPVDAEFGGRVVPPVGDHGLHRTGPAGRFGKHIGLFTDSRDLEIQQIVSNLAWMIEEDGGAAPQNVGPVRPDLQSRWLRGYGTVLRATGQAPSAVSLEMRDALIVAGKKDQPGSPRELQLLIPMTGPLQFGTKVTGKALGYNQAHHEGTLKQSAAMGMTRLEIEMKINDDKWVKGGKATYTIDFDRDSGFPMTGAFKGEFNGQPVSGTIVGKPVYPESFAVLRAGQSWGHHHEDKGSLWFWGRNVHFFGDCSWGGPPGGTYWNPFKQGPASGTQIELKGITNWTLPCKYAAPWISDEQYNPEAGYDYVNARCRYPFNPKLDLSASTPVALTNGYDRQVLFIHPDILVVRDNVESNCDTVWRMHSYQKEGAKVGTGGATLVSPQGVVGDLVMAYPKNVEFETLDAFPEIHPYTGKTSNYAGQPFKSKLLEWSMPSGQSATWVFAVRDEDDKQPSVELLDDAGRVVRITLPDGTRHTVLLSRDPFTYKRGDMTFEGRACLITVDAQGRRSSHVIRGRLRATE